MARIRHIAINTEDPERIAAFYKEVFGMKELADRRMREHSPMGSIRLTDGYINLAIQRCRTDDDPCPGKVAPNGVGIHHIGFEVEDLVQTCAKLERAKSKPAQLFHRNERTGVDVRRTSEQKWRAPDGVVLDISSTGWEIADVAP